jgi:hypothetical protein
MKSRVLIGIAELVLCMITLASCGGGSSQAPERQLTGMEEYRRVLGQAVSASIR